MNIIDNLLRDGDHLYDQWNLTDIPFAESAEKLDRLAQVFTGREAELGQVVNLLRSRDAKSFCDDSITLDELEQLKVETFNEILPRLDKLVEFDLLKRMPTERATEYAPVPLLEGEPGDVAR